MNTQNKKRQNGKGQPSRISSIQNRRKLGEEMKKRKDVEKMNKEKGPAPRLREQEERIG